MDNDIDPCSQESSTFNVNLRRLRRESIHSFNSSGSDTPENEPDVRNDTNNAVSKRGPLDMIEFGLFGSSENLSDFPVQVLLQAAVKEFLHASQYKSAHSEVITGIRFICEQFGFPVELKSSRYSRTHCEGSSSGGQNVRQRRSKRDLMSQVLLRAEFVCSSEHNDACQFNIVLTGCRAPSGSPRLSQEYCIIKSTWDHCHPADMLPIHRSLPFSVQEEMKSLSTDCYLRPADTVRLIERRYGRKLDKKAILNTLSFYRSQLYPVHRDAAAFLDNLRKIKDEQPSTFYSVALDSEYRLKNVAFALPLWIEDLFTFGVVLGVSVDAKALSCT